MYHGWVEARGGGGGGGGGAGGGGGGEELAGGGGGGGGGQACMRVPAADDVGSGHTDPMTRTRAMGCAPRFTGGSCSPAVAQVWIGPDSPSGWSSHCSCMARRFLQGQEVGAGVGNHWALLAGSSFSPASPGAHVHLCGCWSWWTREKDSKGNTHGHRIGHSVKSDPKL